MKQACGIGGGRGGEGVPLEEDKAGKRTMLPNRASGEQLYSAPTSSPAACGANMLARRLVRPNILAAAPRALVLNNAVRRLSTLPPHTFLPM